MSLVRYCPECGKTVPAGIVRHPRCYMEAMERVAAYTSRQWRQRNWGEEHPSLKGGEDIEVARDADTGKKND